MIDDRPGSDFRPCQIDPGCPCGAGGEPTHDDLAEVWCSKCDQPATTMIALTTGESRAYCSQDAWLIRAPKGN